ncbi:hypothetical protein [Streptomyces sp. S465]|uniref:hypothetical protein n=1 Tax=Streptomyces sp. S465 TaxID=2979468 RepID=UPI0022A8373A|nr:hypothetical protein [Streptomyces sp. S465]WAP55280.1 hypothetical protein N6H00_09980 [Streptomyces sp. S465]
MDYRQLFTDTHRRPNAYGLDGSYHQYVAFITGCDAGNDWGLLVGFPEWLALKAGTEANVAWPSLVLKVAEQFGAGDYSSDAKSNSKAVAALFSLLDEFLSERAGAKGASNIISRYVNRRQEGT